MNKLINFIGDILKVFVLVYGFTMLATCLFLVVFFPGAEMKSYFVNMVIFSFAAVLPSILIMHNCEKMTVKQIWLHRILCILVLEVILLPLGKYFEMWVTPFQAFVFGIVVVLVCIGVILADYGKDVLLCSEINQKLYEMNEADK